jgi:hypothetical protein
MNEYETTEIRELTAQESAAVSGGLFDTPGRDAQGPTWADLYNEWAARGRSLAAVSKAMG